MNKTIFIAAMLAVATVLAAGLTVLPLSVQEAQANPCSLDSSAEGGDAENGGTVGASTGGASTDNDPECHINGNDIDFEED